MTDDDRQLNCRVINTSDGISWDIAVGFVLLFSKLNSTLYLRMVVYVLVHIMISKCALFNS